MNDLQEAPASATLSVITPKGYNALFTLREMNGTTLLEKISKLEEVLEGMGYKPQPTRTFGAKKEVEYVEGSKCPKCGGRLLKKKSFKTGKEFHPCENGKFENGVKSGCDYVDWLEPKVEFNHSKPYEGETIPIEAYDHL